MGINGLLKGLKPFSQKKSVREFSGQSLAVDASSWFHKSVYSISERYVESMEENFGRLDPKCVQTSTRYVIGRCEELLTHARIARIYLVLDGKRCPLKAQTNQDREERRQKNLTDARRYKRAGRRDKAEEKYKACIKIKSHFARAVADAVMQRFARDERVQCVFSPYEADAQLVKLCLSGLTNAIVTEDSDVLVYLASCHCNYPILFKLERDTGACDVVTMDWLLSPDTSSSLLPQQGQQQQASAGGALESVLRSLASREARRPGAGARLFVQACVLAGCDYAPSRLNGVGLVTAFKLVRDNAHRPSTERFRHVLSSLSKKARGKEDMVDYEDMLAKSEAIFYYHPVLQLDDGQVIPLTVPLTVEPEAANEGEDDLKLVSDHRPCMERFGTDWSFLGIMGEDQKNESIFPVDDNVPVPEIVVPVKKSSKRAPSRVQPVEDAGLDEVNEIINIVNPYARSRKQDDRRPPLSKVDSNKHKKSKQQQQNNPFARFGPGSQERRPKRKGPGMEIYLNNRQDVRFVKRKFSRDGSSSESTPFVNAVRQRQQMEEVRPASRQQEPPHVAYSHPAEEQEEAAAHHEYHDSGGYEQDDRYVQQDSPEYDQPVMYDDNDPTVYPNPSSNNVDGGQFVYELDSFDDDGVESKYFASARRITLEEPPADDNVSDARHPGYLAGEERLGYAAQEQHHPAQYSSTHANEGSVFSNDFIEDIEPSPAPATRARPFQDNGGWISTNKPSSRPPSSKRASSIKEAFALQRMRASTYSDVEDIESPPISAPAPRYRSKQKSISDYFGKSPSPQNPFLYT